MKRAKIIALILALCTIFSMSSTVLAYDMTIQNNTLLISPNPNANSSIRVLVNDQVIDFTDDVGDVVEPQIMNGRTMVPMRKIFEVFGANVEWEGTTQTITATTENKTLVLQINNTEATVKSGDAEEKITLDSAPVIYDNRTLVPVRFIAESLDLRVGWVPETRTVVILDTSFVYDRLQKEAPNFYDFLTAQYIIQPKTAEIAVSGTATLNYKDNSKSISNIKTLLNSTFKLNEEAFLLNATLKTTGKGELLNTLKEKGFDDITLSYILDSDSNQYIKSSLLESQVGKKWAKIAGTEELQNVIEYKEATDKGATYKEMVDAVLEAIELNENTYYEINEVVNVICGFLSDEHFTVSGRTTKTYTYKLSLEDAINILNLAELEDEIKDNTQIAKAQINYTIKVKDNYVSSENLQLDLTIEDDTEKADLKIDLKSTVEKINEEISITMPRAKDIQEIN